ncbi:Cytochrome P450 [Streptomyces atratus]|uniref:Cytochrome P450 n=1 Tax=Streptomyces atratus TaxID=1893 RepID=A0A1K2F1L5_STRAR|nr:Cytochrome P450 [Streptomyces atratus]
MTTVNLITNGMLTLLRNPEVLHRLREDARLAVPLVEELLRFEPPVQLPPQRTTLADIDIAGTTIPRGASLWLVLASGNRDPKTRPDRTRPQARRPAPAGGPAPVPAERRAARTPSSERRLRRTPFLKPVVRNTMGGSRP